MRKRITLSADQLDQVAKLRRGKGYSWLKIEGETGVPRRIAKREYERWESERGREILQTVRREVAADEFKQHLEALLAMAADFGNILRLPAPAEIRPADEVVRLRVGEMSGYRFQDDDLSPLEHLSPRQRRWLYEGLRVHTRETVPWDKLDQWARDWGRYCDARGLLETEPQVKAAVRALPERIEDSGTEIGNGTWAVIWNRLMSGSLGPSSPEALVESVGNLWSDEHQGGHDRSLEALIESLVRVILASDAVRRARQALARMRASAELLEEALDPMKVRPTLLRTRCEFCPA